MGKLIFPKKQAAFRWDHEYQSLTGSCMIRTTERLYQYAGTDYPSASAQIPVGEYREFGWQDAVIILLDIWEKHKLWEWRAADPIDQDLDELRQSLETARTRLIKKAEERLDKPCYEQIGYMSLGQRWRHYRYVSGNLFYTAVYALDVVQGTIAKTIIPLVCRHEIIPVHMPGSQYDPPEDFVQCLVCKNCWDNVDDIEQPYQIMEELPDEVLQSS